MASIESTTKTSVTGVSNTLTPVSSLKFNPLFNSAPQVSAWSQSPSPQPKASSSTFTVVGKDLLTGAPLVSSPEAQSPTRVEFFSASPQVGSLVQVGVSSGDAGGRKASSIQYQVVDPSGRTTYTQFGTPSSPPPGKEDCPPPPPPPPPSPDPPAPPGPDGGGGGGGGGSDPGGGGDLGGDPGGSGGGSDPCSPESDIRWFSGPSCPPGMASLGSATLPDGSVRSLCKGSGPPPDGCGGNKWVCDSTTGSCIQSSNGIYDTQAECEAAGCSVIRYSCVGGECVATEGGTYPTYDACLGSGCQIRYTCTPTGCVEGPEGQYRSLAECQAACVVSGRTWRGQGTIDRAGVWTGFPAPVDASICSVTSPTLYLVTGSNPPTDNAIWLSRTVVNGTTGEVETVTQLYYTWPTGVTGVNVTFTDTGVSC